MYLKPKDIKNVGGFAGINSGTISDSYSKAIFSKQLRPGSFCIENLGEISRCLSSGTLGKKLVSKFVSKGTDGITTCFLNVKKESDQDDNGIIRKCDFSNTSIDQSNFDLDKVWVTTRDNNVIADLEFNPQTWVYNIEFENSEENLTSVSSREELIKICRQINEGDPKSVTGTYILEKDIDLKGMKWTPIGDDLHPFKGKFDGQGHKIYNFKVTDRSLLYAGFFGNIENAFIANLSVDGIITTGVYSGTFVGINKDGLIACCSASSHIRAEKCTGGFVGRNTGIIDRCCYTGKIKKDILLWWILIIPIIILLMLALLYIFNPLRNTAVFNNVPIDSSAVKRQEISNTGESNTASFSLKDTIIFSHGTGDLSLDNPGTSNQSMQVKIQITDKELLNKIGSTGRSKKEQRDLESNNNYDPENSRVTICETGLILPGYYLPQLKLLKLPNNRELPSGVYSGIVLMSFYDFKTNEKAIVNSQMLVTIVKR